MTPWPYFVPSGYISERFLVARQDSQELPATKLEQKRCSPFCKSKDASRYEAKAMKMSMWSAWCVWLVQHSKLACSRNNVLAVVPLHCVPSFPISAARHQNDRHSPIH